jgi:asparagine synthase (glutamine-hydrolysing)
MSGLGADELFCGYNPFHALLLNTRKPRPMDQVRDRYLRSVTLLPGWLGEKIGNRILASHELSSYLASWNRVAPSVIGELTDRDADETVFRLAEYIAEHVELSGRRLNRIKQYAMFQYMGSMLLRDSDAVSMRHSLEVRVPFLDPRLVAFSFSLPDEFLIRASSRTLARRSYGIGCKKLLLDAFKHLLPPGFDQRQKNGFELPHDYWMRHGLRARIREVMLGGDPFFNRSVKQDVYDRWLRGKASWKTVWSVFVFLCWWDRTLR